MDFRKFYHESGPIFWLFLVRLAGNEEDAADAMQNAYEQFLIRAKKKDFDPAYAERILFRLGYQAFVDLKRNTVRDKKRVFAAAALDGYKFDYLDPHDEQLEIDELLEKLLKVENRSLTPRQKTVLQLRVLCGLRPDEIMDILNLGRQSYYRDMRRIRYYLARDLERNDV